MQGDFLRDHVEGGPAMDARDAHHGCLQRGDVAGDDGLQRIDYVCRGDNRVDRDVWDGAVPAPAHRRGHR